MNKNESTKLIDEFLDADSKLSGSTEDTNKKSESENTSQSAQEARELGRQIGQEIVRNALNQNNNEMSSTPQESISKRKFPKLMTKETIIWLIVMVIFLIVAFQNMRGFKDFSLFLLGSSCSFASLILARINNLSLLKHSLLGFLFPIIWVAWLIFNNKATACKKCGSYDSITKKIYTGTYSHYTKDGAFVKESKTEDNRYLDRRPVYNEQKFCKDCNSII